MAIEGRVAAGGREAMISVEVLGGNGRRRAWIEAVLDTGFTGYLTLPNEVAVSLSLASRGSRDAVLASFASRVVDLDVYRARVVWHGRERPVSVLGAEGAPLVGMALLFGSELRIRSRAAARSPSRSCLKKPVLSGHSASVVSVASAPTGASWRAAVSLPSSCGIRRAGKNSKPLTGFLPLLALSPSAPMGASWRVAVLEPSSCGQGKGDEHPVHRHRLRHNQLQHGAWYDPGTESARVIFDA